MVSRSRHKTDLQERAKGLDRAYFELRLNPGHPSVLPEAIKQLERIPPRGFGPKARQERTAFLRAMRRINDQLKQAAQARRPSDVRARTARARAILATIEKRVGFSWITTTSKDLIEVLYQHISALALDAYRALLPSSTPE